MLADWDYKTTVTEEELARDPIEHKLAKVIIQRTQDDTYQVLVQRVTHRPWAALATRRAPHYPRQFLRLPLLTARLARRFPYLREVTVEDLNPQRYTLALSPAKKRPAKKTPAK